MSGHPAHQMRKFTITARNATGRIQRVNVAAQTRDDALLRAGMLFAARPRSGGPAHWIVTGVTDPAPRVWSPDEPAPGGQP